MDKKQKFLDANQKYGYICNNTVYGGDCYGRSYCDNYSECLKDHPNQFCEECKVYICGCCDYHKCLINGAYPHTGSNICPVCENEDTCRDVTIKEIYQKRLTGLYPY